MAVDLNYEKDSKERIPYEHYLEVYQNADPKEISSRCDVPYDAEKQEFTVSLMGVSYRISWPEYNVFHIGDDGSASPIIGWYPLELDAFREIMERVGAQVISSGDVGYELEFMKGLFVRLILWAGDDEFPPSAQILFSDNFPAAFTQGEDMAVVGDVTIDMLKALAAK